MLLGFYSSMVLGGGLIATGQPAFRGLLDALGARWGRAGDALGARWIGVQVGLPALLSIELAAV